MSSYGIRALVASLSAFSSVFMAGLAAMAAARVVSVPATPNCYISTICRHKSKCRRSRFQVRGW
jgi:hypothetical protein